MIPCIHVCYWYYVHMCIVLCYWYSVHTCIVLLIPCIHVCYKYPVYTCLVLLIPCINLYGLVYLFEQPVSKSGLQRGYVISLYTKYYPEKQSTFTRDHIILEARFTEVQGNFSVARGKCNEEPKHNVSSLSGYTSAKNTYNDRSVSLRCTGTAQSV
jgi:hypothetical protein